MGADLTWRGLLEPTMTGWGDGVVTAPVIVTSAFGVIEPPPPFAYIASPTGPSVIESSPAQAVIAAATARTIAVLIDPSLTVLLLVVDRLASRP
jgi:hypothetical protein